MITIHFIYVRFTQGSSFFAIKFVHKVAPLFGTYSTIELVAVLLSLLAMLVVAVYNNMTNKLKYCHNHDMNILNYFFLNDRGIIVKNMIRHTPTKYL